MDAEARHRGELEERERRIAELEAEKAERLAREERIAERRGLAVQKIAEAQASKEALLEKVPEEAKAAAGQVLEKVAAAPQTVQASHRGVPLEELLASYGETLPPPTQMQSRGQRAEEPRNLVAVHNLSERGLRHALKMGGLPVPSIAIARADREIPESFGDITLVGGPQMVTPSRTTKVADADAYSPRYPSVQARMDGRTAEAINNFLASVRSPALDSYSDTMDGFAGNLQDSGWQKAAEDHSLFMAKWLEEIGRPFQARPGEERYEARGRLRNEIQEAEKAGHPPFARWIEGLPEREGWQLDERIFDGFTPSGFRRYLPHTLENVVKIMRRKFKGGENFNYGVGNIRAAASKRFRSLAAIQARRDQIIPKAQMDALKEEVDKEFFALAQEMDAARGADSSQSLQSAADDLMALAEGGRDNAQHLRERFAPDTGILPKMRDFLVKLQGLPTEYFEAKPQRAVGLSEFHAAIVPEGFPADLQTALEEQGLTVRAYPKGDAEARRQAVETEAQQSRALFSKTAAPAAPKPRSNIRAIVDAVKGYFGGKMPKNVRVVHQEGRALREAAYSLTSGPEAERQIAQVRRQYEGTPLWMKAPNGQPTKLTERQWLQVRTPNFKRWFGDWEAMADEAAFVSAVDAITAGTYDMTRPVPLGTTPEAWLAAGADALPITMPPTMVKKVTQEEHDLPVALIRQVARAIKDPVFIFESASVADALTVILDLKHKGQNVLVAVHLNKREGNHEVNRIASIYDKNKPRAVEGWIRAGLLRYAHQQKSRDWFRSRGLRLPKEGTPRGNRTLRTEADVVNRIVNPDTVSKVVDENGEPMVVYHGTPDGRFIGETGVFTGLKERFTGDTGKGAHWFARSRDTAASYADDRRAFDYQNAEPGIVAAFLNIRNPFDHDGDHQAWRTAQKTGKTSNVIEQAQKAGRDGVIVRNVVDDYSSLEKSSLGAITDTFTVFDSTQIKSATENTGAFDPANPDIRYSLTEAADLHKRIMESTLFNTSSEGLSETGAAKDLRNEAAASYRGKSEVINKATGNKIRIEPSGIKNTLKHSLGLQKRATVQVLDGLLEEAAFVARDTEDIRQGVKAVETYAGRVMVDGTPFIVRLVVREVQDGRRFYDHELSSLTPQSARPEGYSGGSEGAFADRRSKLQTRSSLGKRLLDEALAVNPDIRHSAPSEAAWDARLLPDGTIELNAAHLDAGDVPFKIEHEIGHQLHNDPKMRPYFDRLLDALSADQRKEIEGIVSRLYSDSQATEETRVRALEAIRRMAAQSTPDSALARAWKTFVQYVRLAWNRLTGQMPKNPELLAARMVEIGLQIRITQKNGQEVKHSQEDLATESREPGEGSQQIHARGEQPTDPIPSPTGHLDWSTFVRWDAEQSQGRIKALPIRMLRGAHHGPHKGFGMAHINEEHQRDFESAGVLDKQRFIHRILLDFNEVYADGGRLLLVANRPKSVSVVELREEAGGFYSVVTAFPKENPAWRPRGERILGGRKAAFAQSERAPARTAQGQTSPKPPLEPLAGKDSWEYFASLRENVNPNTRSNTRPGSQQIHARGAEEEGDGIDDLLRDLDAEIADWQEAALSEEASGGRRTIGRPDLAHGADNADIRGIDEAYTENFQPQTHEQWEKEGAAMVERDFEGTRRAIQEAGFDGRGISPAQAKAATIIKNELYRRMVKTGDPADRRAFNLFFYAYRQSGATEARSLGARRDPLKTPAERHRDFLIDFMTRPRKAAQKAIDVAPSTAEKDRTVKELEARLAQALRDADQARAKRIQAELALERERKTKEFLIDQETAALLKKLKDAGITHQDILGERVALSLMEKNILDQFRQILARGGSEARKVAFDLIRRNRAFEEIAKKTGLPEAEVRKIKADFVAQMRADHFRKFLTGAKADAPNVVTGRTVEKAVAEREFSKWLKKMGIVEDESQGRPKFSVEDPAHVVRMARAIQAARGEATLGDMAYEWWIMNILSGPQTHVANITGNAGMAALDMTLQRGMEALFNTIVRDSKAPES